MHTRIEEIRKSKGLKKNEFAHILGITQQSYSNYSQGKRTIPTDLSIKIKQLFNVSIDWLLTGEGTFSLDADSIKDKILNNIDRLNEEQLKSVDSFIEFEINKN